MSMTLALVFLGGFVALLVVSHAVAAHRRYVIRRLRRTIGWDAPKVKP